jgi:uncharacterized OsmC-like protein
VWPAAKRNDSDSTQDLKSNKQRKSTMTTQTQVTINGIDTAAFEEIIDSMKADPSLTECHFRARNKWVDGPYNQTTIDGFYGAGQEQERPQPFVHHSDEPALMLGGDKGANAVEFVLTALASCLTGTMIYYGAMMGIKLDSVEAFLEGDMNIQGLLGLNEDVRNGYENVRVSYRIESPEPRERIEELLEIGKRHSPVLDMMCNPVPVTVALAR